MKRITAFAAIFLLISSCDLLAADIQVAGSVDKRQAQVDEEISFTIRILGAHGNVQAPRLPAFQGFDSFYTGRTSQFTFVNGQSNSTVEFNYVLVPKVAGRFTLAPVEVWIEGKRFQTQPVELEVIGPRVQQASPPPAPNQAPVFKSLPPASPAPISQPAAPPVFIQDDNVFVKAAIDKQTAFPNEQILLTYTLYTRYDTRYEGFEEEPSVSGFWIEDFPLDRDLGRDTVTVHGRRYVKADIRKIALFPTAPAPYTIQPGVLKVSVREQPKTTNLFDDFFNDSFFTGAGFFAQRVERLLKPEPLSITVRPFPENGKPASFNGAVGQFRMSSSADKNSVKQNEPVNLKIVIEGEGNIETLPKPKVPELTGFKVYEGDSSTQLFKSGSTIAGKKSFEVIFIPTEAGELAIPPLEFSFFDPRRESYEVLRTGTVPLKVIPSAEPLRLPAELAEKEGFKKEVRLETQDIHYLHEELTSEGAARIQSFAFRFLLALNLAGLLAVGSGLWKRRREALFSRDTALKRRTLARAQAFRQMKPLGALAQSEKPEEGARFLGEAEKVLNEYLSHKFNVSSYHLTKEWLREKLTSLLGPEDPLLKRVLEFYEVAHETRFGRGMLLAQERREFFKLIRSVIDRIEKLPEKSFTEK